MLEKLNKETKSFTSEEKFMDFKDSVDFLVSNGDWKLIPKNIVGHSTLGSFDEMYCYNTKKARLYLEEARNKMGYYEKTGRKRPNIINNSSEKERQSLLPILVEAIDYFVQNNMKIVPKALNNYFIEKIGYKPSSSYYYLGTPKKLLDEAKQKIKESSKIEEVTLIEEITPIKNDNLMDKFLVNYIKDVIDTCAKNAVEKISINMILDMIPTSLKMPIDAKYIATNKEIVSYLDNTNKRIEDENNVINKIKECYNKLMKCGLTQINRYNLLLECSEFLDYNYLNSHNNILKVIEDLI